jgi:hypothetical protein
MVLPLLLGPLIGLAGSVVGGAMRNSAAARQAEQQYANDRAAAELQRKWQLEDRTEAREYNASALVEARNYDRGAIKRLVADAEEAGFNPLTLLRNGGGAGYSGGYAPLSEAPLSRTAPVRQAPYQGGVGEAVGNWAGNFMAGFDPFADDRRELEYQLVQAQVRNLNASTASFQSFRAPTYSASSREQRPSGTAGSLSQRTLLDQDNVPLVVGPGSPAEEWETEYGEVAGELEGLPRYLRDRVWPVVKNTANSFLWPKLGPPPSPGYSGRW